ncbi:MAG: SCO family protein [Labilithrix sp.]|nr:SCO family protein [Labilithrix sp.]MBX3223907.1 SCO family protein [Labilithrix sp.]
MSRRQWLAAAVTVPAAGALVGWRAAVTANAEGIKGGYFPNVWLYTHEGRRVRFYDDLVRGKVVVVSFMYSKCRGVCPGITQNLARVQRLLEPSVGRDVFMYSISIKPDEDTPEVLGRYVAGLGIGPGWSFLTGAPDDIERIRRSLGAVDPDPAVDADKSQHIGMLRYGNERLERWAACPGGAKPEWIAQSIRWMTDEGASRHGTEAAL